MRVNLQLFGGRGSRNGGGSSGRAKASGGGNPSNNANPVSQMSHAQKMQLRKSIDGMKFKKSFEDGQQIQYQISVDGVGTATISQPKHGSQYWSFVTDASGKSLDTEYGGDLHSSLEGAAKYAKSKLKSEILSKKH